MSQGSQFDLRLNRRQMMLLGGAACVSDVFAKSALAQVNNQFQGCVEVEPWYTVQLKRNPMAAGLTIADANRLSAEEIQANFVSPEGKSKAAAMLSVSPSPKAMRALNPAAQSQASRALQQHLSGQLSSPSSGPQRPLRAIVDRMKVWPHGQKAQTVTYGFFDISNTTLVNFIDKAFIEWARHCCLPFQKTDIRNSPDIRISFVAGAGHYSLVGIDSKNRTFSPNFSGNQESLNLDPTGGNLRYLEGTALHEVGHAIGLCHEHQSSKGGIVWDEAAVREYFRRTQYWDDDTILSNILTKLNDTEEYAQTERDEDSVMHYFFPQYLAPTSKIPLEPNLVLSNTDKTFVAQQYECKDVSQDDQPDPKTDPKTDTKTAVVSDRQKLKPADAVSLTADKPLKSEFPADPQMLLFKIDGTSDDYVFETVDGARAGVPFGGAMPVVLELFDGTDFSEGKSIQVSSFGAIDAKNPLLTSLGAQDAFLTAKLSQGTTYYVLARPQQRLKTGSKGAFTLLARKAKSSRDTKGTWNQLRQEISETQREIGTVQSKTTALQKGLRQ